jgi:glycosyltransferase involved in cell wall biosynthesis
VKVAFYAPLKAPDHPVPSGDRALSRLLMRALAHAGHETILVSRFRSFDGRGDHQRQVRLARVGDRLAMRLAARLRAQPPDLWFTYHVHHKAPDLLGPYTSATLDIPYVIAEASVAPKQRDGAWAVGYARALDAIRAADTIVSVNPEDVAQVRRARARGADAAMLAPFIDVSAFAAEADASHSEERPDAPARLVTVAMMRDGAKLASYRSLAAALEQLRDVSWRLTIIGDGPARPRVEAAFEGVRDRVTFAGARAAPDIARTLTASDVFVWPAIDEAFGMAFLEAQACGLPVVGAASAGVASVVVNGRTGALVAPGDAAAFAAALRRLLDDPSSCRAMGIAASAHVREHHDLPVAALTLDGILRAVVARRHSDARPPGSSLPAPSAILP